MKQGRLGLRVRGIEVGKMLWAERKVRGGRDKIRDEMDTLVKIKLRMRGYEGVEEEEGEEEQEEVGGLMG